MAETRNVFGLPETVQERKARDLRESGWTGPIDQDGDKARVVGTGVSARIEKVK